MTAPTSRKLADALREVPGVPAAMIRRAEQGYYHDFLSPLDHPIIQLVTDLRALIADPAIEVASRSALRAMVDQAMTGAFDATSAEADEWMRSPEGQQTLAELLGKVSRTNGRRRR